MKRISRVCPAKEIPGETLFKLYDTYGFPADLTADIARERGLAVDMAGFEREMEAQRERARAASQFGGGYAYQLEIEGETEFTGYDRLSDSGRGARTLCRRQNPPMSCTRGEEGLVVLDRTPFYAESGGQVGDCGALAGEHGSFDVRDTQKLGRVHAHFGMASHGDLRKSAAGWRPTWIRVVGATRLITIRPPTCCTPRCARSWASTCSRRARWWRPTGCASTSPISSR